MSALLIPALAIGGVYLLYDSITKKNNHKHKSKSSSSTFSSIRRKISSSSSSSSNTTSKDDKIVNLYVYYSYGKNKGKLWKYKNLAPGWSIKSKTDIIDNQSNKYKKLVIFIGKQSTEKEMKNYLELAFEYLSNKKIIKNYLIVNKKL